MSEFQLFMAIVAVVSFTVCANDPSSLQDFCVAIKDSNASVFVNGKICKDPETVTAEDFFYSGLHRRGNITSSFGTKLTQVFITQMPGLNTLGIAMVRIDYLPGGLNPPHVHPRASEMIVVLEGTIHVGFITANPTDPNSKPKLFAKTLFPGDVFLFPQGLVHFQHNVGNSSAVAIAALNSQNPGFVTLPRALFWSEPPLDHEVVEKTFRVEEKLVEYWQSMAWRGNN
ncbi:putative germin-like protein 2-1 [Andrographis paniculata]|uniref:putative germin-like protein 2-1 n=1 Tax=Andrographis paniculata TaxID=175694 RepID=UPI0021E90E3F|nr:putative germin-like protein 2-1 [Andrographis paniculata]